MTWQKHAVRHDAKARVNAKNHRTRLTAEPRFKFR